MPSRRSILFVLIILAAGFLRFAKLEERPIHADEATAASIMGDYLESQDYQFDPVHFHGPWLLYSTLPFASALGENSFETLNKETLRLSTALAGTLTIASFILFIPWLGTRSVAIGMLLATASSLLLYYSRVWIHESWFGLFTLLSLAAILHYTRKPSLARASLCGLSIGLMFVTRETVAISILAWSAAAALTVPLKDGIPFVLKNWKHPAIASVTLLVTAFAFYSSFGSNPEGFIHAFKTYFVYETTPGHDKHFYWYLGLMLWPSFQEGFWSHELPLFLLALIGIVAAFIKSEPTSFHSSWAKFIAISALLHLLIYSAIAYKTPWLMLGTWLHVILLAAYGCRIALERFSPKWKLIYAILLASSFLISYGVANRASFKFHSDPRNPYAYSPSSRSGENIEKLLIKLRDIEPAIQSEAIAVIGQGYWPLPWYLRSFENVGYWKEVSEDINQPKVIIATPDQSEALSQELGESYFSARYGLRYGFPVTVFVDNKLWEKYQSN